MGVARSSRYRVPCFHAGNSPTLPQLPVLPLCFFSGTRFALPEWRPGHSRVADFPYDAIVTFTVHTALFTAVFMTSVVTFAEPISQFDASQERARKEYEAAMARIGAVSKADQQECARQTGPAAKACTIQADGKRFASQQEAKLALARARDQHEGSETDPKKAAAAGKRHAKAEYGVAKARLKQDCNLANAQCSKLKDAEAQECKKDVGARYAIASDAASAAYARAIAKADARLMGER